MLYPWAVFVLMMVVGKEASFIAHLCGMAVESAHTTGAFAMITPAATGERQGFRGHQRRLSNKNEHMVVESIGLVQADFNREISTYKINSMSVGDFDTGSSGKVRFRYRIFIDKSCI
jgi:hypothetical protein